MNVSLALGLACWKAVAMSWKASVSDEAAKTTISPETGAAAGLAAVGAAGAGADVLGVVHAARKTKKHTSGVHRGLEIASTREDSVGRECLASMYPLQRVDGQLFDRGEAGAPDEQRQGDALDQQAEEDDPERHRDHQLAFGKLGW